MQEPLVSPIDIIPDFIPVLGQLDDLLIVPILIYAAVAFIPASVKAECRARTARLAAEVHPPTSSRTTDSATQE